MNTKPGQRMVRRAEGILSAGRGEGAVSTSARASRQEVERRWLADNAEAIRLENQHIDTVGLPLEAYRLF